MKQTSTTAEEIRSTKRRLIARYYSDKGVIEIWQKDEEIIIIVPIGTPLHVCHGKAFSTK